ncbi:MAG: protein translocase subunit SecF [bacterium]|nr:protein translocase subunit SecF [bacterium]MDZ4296489.1 protein translocase subunit SecF [Patescibacteria group bacterium]
MSFTRYRKIFYGFSLTLAVAGVMALALFGVEFGNEFTGGSILEVEFTATRPTPDDVRRVLDGLDLGPLTIQPSGERAHLLRFRSVEEAVHQEILTRVKTLDAEAAERRFEAIGPTIGRELRTISIWTTIVSLIAIFIYLVIAFRNVPRRLGAHKFAGLVIVTLIHDLAITAGLLAIIGQFTSLEIGVPVLAAFLVIAGYSINDTIIVFDRIRERATRAAPGDFSGEIDQAILTTLRRSLFTSFTTILALIAILLFGGPTLKTFALTLIVGIVVGTYSSVAIASPLLLTLSRFDARRAVVAPARGS